ncbi:LEM domain-containing protein 1 [Heterocephalus glaber]|uniref:LEM domain-containing protein 1 n=1 Tax=Heterocephalus glaber TaxID=10181 RepID=G5BX42_HETGA|nr:LEM domain-containing protein 1 [Heterocephalus glaber]
MVDVQCLSDGELQKQFKEPGFSPGPILHMTICSPHSSSASTRKVYEQNLVQLSVPPPCAPPMLNGPRKPDGSKDKDDSEELIIPLKGDLRLSIEKSKDSKKVWIKLRTLHLRGSCSCFHRCSARAQNTRIKSRTVPQEKEPCMGGPSGVGGLFPLCLQLAVLGILIIVVFVYITMEKKPLFG